MLRVESVSGGERRNECVNLLLRLLIAKAVGADERSLKSPHSEQLRELRAQIYSNPAKKFSIDELSKQISLSPTYFQTLYKSEFDVSCYEDILRAKTELAEYYLKSTNLSVCRISELCGYENDVHFMRQFHRRKGMTALKFREYNK